MKNLRHLEDSQIEQFLQKAVSVVSTHESPYSERIYGYINVQLPNEYTSSLKGVSNYQSIIGNMVQDGFDVVLKNLMRAYAKEGDTSNGLTADNMYRFPDKDSLADGLPVGGSLTSYVRTFFRARPIIYIPENTNHFFTDIVSEYKRTNKREREMYIFSRYHNPSDPLKSELRIFSLTNCISSLMESGDVHYDSIM